MRPIFCTTFVLLLIVGCLQVAEVPSFIELKNTGLVWSATFSPDGTKVVTGSWDNTARIWDPACATLLAP